MNILNVIIIVLSLTVLGNVFYLIVNKMIQIGTKQKENKKTFLYSFLNASSFIGYFERIIIFVALMSSSGVAIQALSILIAIKSFLRYPEIKDNENDKITAEKFIVGTLCSIVWVLIVIYIVKSI